MKISADFPEPLPPPKKSDVLFGFSSRDPWSNACVNTEWQPDSFYALGYREGAQRLANHVLETHSDQDTLIFPIVFLYRHHLELALKRIVQITAIVSDVPLTGSEAQRLFGRHELDQLWAQVKQRLRSAYEKANLELPDRSAIEGADSYIRQVSGVDPKSQAFRYPVSSKGAPHLRGIRHINIRALAECMERLCDFLERIEGELLMYLEVELEMRASVP